MLPSTAPVVMLLLPLAHDLDDRLDGVTNAYLAVNLFLGEPLNGPYG